MTAISTRLIVTAESQPDPLDADNPQLLFIHDRAGITIDPVAVKNGPAPLDSEPDLWDLLVGARFDQEGLTILYEAELQANSEIVVKRDLLESYGLREYPHNWSGWPIPGSEGKPPKEGEASPKLTEKQKAALAGISRKNKGDDAKKTLHVRGKVSNWEAEVSAKKPAGRK